MRFKKYIRFILFLLIPVQYGYTQQLDITKGSFIEVGGSSNFQLKGTIENNTSTFYTSAGFLNIRLTEVFNKQSAKLYYSTYYREHNSKNTVTTKMVLKGDGGRLYLNVGQEFFMDIFDQKTKNLVRRYIVKRPRLVPQIKLIHHSKGNSPVYFSYLDDRYNKLKISPDEIVTLNRPEKSGAEPLEIEYTLINLKTKKSEYKTNLNEPQSLNLTPNTDYELRFNYVVQPESVAIVHIEVKGYWYQSAVIYIIFFISLIVIGFLFVTIVLKNKVKSSHRERQKIEEAAMRLQSLLNPHFIFNALSSIQGLMNTDRIEEANYYLQEFSALLRTTLTKSQQLFNNLNQELEMMQMYIRLEALRFNFSWSIEISDKLNISEIEIPTLLLQPLIENSIKHGLLGQGSQGKLLITCKEGLKKDTFVIIIKDNGTWVNKSSDSGYGLSLTAERILTINKMKKEQAIVLDFNKQIGTEAVLTFHNWIN